MRTAVLTFVVVVFFGVNAIANVGVFYGSGKTIELIKSDQVQLVSEEVTISPQWGAVAELDRVEYRCKFILKNRSEKSVKVYVGFPLDRELHGTTTPDATDTVLSYHFIARDADNTYHVQYVSGGGDTSKYNELFLWEMAFAAGETKVLQVGYILPMSITMSLTNREQGTIPKAAIREALACDARRLPAGELPLHYRDRTFLGRTNREGDFSDRGRRL